MATPDVKTDVKTDVKMDVKPAKPTLKTEQEPMVISSPSKPLPSPSKVVFPPLPPSTPVGNWILTGHSFAPQREYFMRFCKGLAKRRVTDHLMWFRFPRKQFNKPNRVAVHYSRLAWVGGPLARLLVKPLEPSPKLSDDMPDADPTVPLVVSPVPETDKPSPAKKLPDDDPPWMTEDESSMYIRDDPVELTEKDMARTFDIVVKFLYCEEICFNFLTFDEIVTLAQAAHKWALTDLYNATFSYVMDQNLLAGGHGIRTFIPLVSHAETPESFRRYFCIAVGHHFDVLYPRLKAHASTAQSLGTTDRPALWDVIMQQKMFSHVVHCIRRYAPNAYDTYLLDVILRIYERVAGVEDDDIIGILSQLNWDNIDTTLVFQRDGMSSDWSARAIRLAALATSSPQSHCLEVRIPWLIPLQKLLKTDVWSFQTEHVLCGPYICYLHVRKNNGPEVSLFVHIWNRDGKPLGDDASHERVKVSCRATECNCSCDSGKQWSDSTHGFLENLKFEGNLKRYPGLGWSQFLEARRLDEWRTSHGAECGLAITTVLQFHKPTRSIDGKRPARSHSPTKLNSPIQKKRAGGLKMKLRDGR